VKAYESPTAEFIEFKDDKILTESSTGCKCYGDQILWETVPGPGNNCEAVTYDQTEVIKSNDPPPWYN